MKLYLKKKKTLLKITAKSVFVLKKWRWHFIFSAPYTFVFNIYMT